MLQSNLNTALTKFGEDFEIVKQGGNVTVKGKTGKIGRANTWLAQFGKEAIFSPDIAIVGGDILHDKTNDIYYFVFILNKQIVKITLVAYDLTLLKINKNCDIYRLQGQSGSFGGIKQQFVVQKTGIRCHLREITADLRTERPALLEIASYLLYIQNSEDLQILDRVIIDAQNYQVEHINKLEVNGIYEAQLSLDKR